MKIVVLDGFTLNPGDLSWEPLQSMGQCVIYDRSPLADVVERAAEAEIVLANKAVLNREQIQRLPRLKYIGVLATGYNNVDIEAARAQGIVVTNVPAYGTQAVAQMTFALLLELTHHVAFHAQTVRAGRWTQSLDFCYWDLPLIELDGLIMGIVGLGRIGQSVATLATAFGMKVRAHSLPPVPPTVEWVDLDRLFQTSDVVSLHCPLTAETRGLVDAQRLARMKPTAFLLNTSRGPLVDEAALAEALNSGRLAGAGLDVLSVEPPPETNPLLRARNCVITPHIAWATRAARNRLLQIALANLRSFIEGKPQNVVT